MRKGRRWSEFWTTILQLMLGAGGESPALFELYREAVTDTLAKHPRVGIPAFSRVCCSDLLWQLYAARAPDWRTAPLAELPQWHPAYFTRALLESLRSECPQRRGTSEAEAEARQTPSTCGNTAIRRRQGPSVCGCSGTSSEPVPLAHARLAGPLPEALPGRPLPGAGSGERSGPGRTRRRRRAPLPRTAGPMFGTAAHQHRDATTALSTCRSGEM